MEVILRQTVAELGRAGEIIQVKAGYARNFLIPRGLAYVATEANKRRADSEAKRRGDRLATERVDADTLAATLGEISLTFTAKSGEGDRLFGSITASDIAGKLADEGYQIDRRVIELHEPIKMIGVYKVPIRLHPDVRAEVRVWVVKE
jgi:large subunit ribosomal protein L9